MHDAYRQMLLERCRAANLDPADPPGRDRGATPEMIERRRAEAMARRAPSDLMEALERGRLAAVRWHGERGDPMWNGYPP